MSEADCIFCRIVRGEIDAELVHDEDDVLAFEDINSKAPVHVLVIPRQHVANLEEIGAFQTPWSSGSSRWQRSPRSSA